MNNFNTSLKPIAAMLLTVLALSGCNRGDNTAATQAKTQEYVERAESYRHQGQYQAAIIETRNALQQNPQDSAARLKLAAIYNELGQGRATTQLLESVIAQPSRDELAALTQAYLLQHKYQSALDLLSANDARLKLSADAEINLLRARAMLRLGQLDAAATVLQRLNANDVRISLELAQLDWLRGDHESSKSRIAQLLQQQPENVDVLSDAARIAEQEGDLNKSEDLLSKALINLPQTDILVPQKSEVLQRLVTTLTKLGRSNEALIYAKALTEANPQGSILQDKFKQGVELFQAGKTDEAEAILTEVYNESHSDSVGALLGMIRYSKNDLKGAADFLTPNVDPEVASDSAMTALAVTQLRLAQPDKLLAVFDAQARTHIENPELKTLVGIALQQTGSIAEGEKLIADAQAAQPENSAIQATIARHYLLSRQPDKAITTLQKGLKAKPDANLSRLLIAAYADAKKPDQALETAQQLAETTPEKAENWWVLGHTALQLQNLEVADSALRNALKLESNYLPAQLDLAQLHVLRKQPDQAAALYQAILKQQPESIGALKGLVAVFVQKGAEPAAVESQLLAAANNDNARAVAAEYYLRRQQFEDAYRLLAEIPDGAEKTYPNQLKQLAALSGTARALQARDFEMARTRVVEGLKVNPRSPELLLMLARVEQGAGKLEEAKKIAAQLNLQQPQHPGLLELEGDLAMIEKQNKAASEHYRKAWSQVGNNGIATKLYQSLAYDPVAATAFLEEWKRRLAESDTPWLLRGLELQRAGDRTGALAAYEGTLSRNPGNVEALNNTAWLYGESNDPRALPLAEKAAKLAPKNAAVLDTYGWLLSRSKQKQAALTVLRQAAELAPQSPEIQAHLKEADQITN